jgi:hypothetical protein
VHFLIGLVTTVPWVLEVLRPHFNIFHLKQNTNKFFNLGYYSRHEKFFNTNVFDDMADKTRFRIYICELNDFMRFLVVHLKFKF